MLSYGSYCFNQLINFTSALVGPNYTTSALMYLGLITPEIQSASTGGEQIIQCQPYVSGVDYPRVHYDNLTKGY
jgi:hypothetical protein